MTSGIIAELHITSFSNNGLASNEQQNTIWIEDNPRLAAWLCPKTWGVSQQNNCWDEIASIDYPADFKYIFL